MQLIVIINYNIPAYDNKTANNRHYEVCFHY